MAHIQEQEVLTQTRTLAIEDIDYIELYVGNAKQAAFYFCRLFGFRVTAFSGLETGVRDRVSYVVEQGKARFVLSSPYTEDHPMGEFVKTRGDAVRDIALRVKNVEATYASAVANGATGLVEPFEEADEFGTVKKAVIGTFGTTVHTLVERSGYEGVFVPGYVAVDSPEPANKTGILCVDHLAVCVEDLEKWTDYYMQTFGFHLLKDFKKDEVSSTQSSLTTRVVQNSNRNVKLTLVTPAAGKKKSQVTEFIEYNRGDGTQHIALLTDNIIDTLDTLNDNGVEFLVTPESYYEMLPGRVGQIEEPLDEIQRLNVLVDRDEDGYLLQIFAHPIQDRPTLFFEVIQRKGSQQFGGGNIKALFEAVEREQAKRGNLE